MSPEPRRRAVRMAVEKFGASERFACKIIGQNRSAVRKTKPDMGFEETRLRGALRAVAVKHPTWGWRKARWCLLAQQWAGMGLNNKRVRRLWREEGLVCKPKARKKRRAGPGAGEQKRLTAEYPMHVVSFDFQSDVTSCGRHIRFFNVIDEYTRTALAIIARRSFTASDVVAALENIIAETGTAPTYVRCDNGPVAERFHRIVQRPVQKGTNRHRPDLRPLRQRSRIHRRRTDQLVQHRRRGHRLHRPWFTVAERFHRIVQRPVQKGTTLGRNHGHHGRSDLSGRGMESYLQS